MNTDQTNKIIIISSPSGAGKTTLCKLLLKKMRNINLSISYTSRNQRLNEIHGKDYFFVTKERFNQLKNKNFFIETAINFGYHYGSPYKNIKTSKKNLILFDIDWKGARKIRKNYKKDDIIDFFILPPSKSELKRRLVKRGRDNKKEINLRLSYAIDEMKHYSEYKYVLINEKVHKTVNEMLSLGHEKKDLIHQYPAFAGTALLARHLTLYELYKRVLDIPGDIAEIGVFKGGAFLYLAKLCEIFEMNAYTRVYGFDWFKGMDPIQGKEEGQKKGSYKNSYQQLKKLISCQKLDHVAKIIKNGSAGKA